MSNKQKKSQLGEKALRFAFGALLIAATIAGGFLLSTVVAEGVLG